MRKIIEVEKISKHYKNVSGERLFKALDDVSLNVEEGGIFGLLGPNGSGKTTLLKLFLGLIFPTKGRLKVLGKSPRDVGTKKRIGYLPENPYYYEFLTPLELLRFYGSLNEKNRSVIEKRSGMLFQKTGLEKFAHTKIRNFSKGMLQRLGLAISLINDPELLFLDEPTLGLDPIGTLEIQNLLMGLKAEGKTIFLSSHLLSQVQDSCDSMAIIYRGRLIKEGRLKDILSLKDELLLTVKGAKDPEKKKRLQSVLEENGYEVTGISEKNESLKDLFIKLIAKERDK